MVVVGLLAHRERVRWRHILQHPTLLNRAAPPANVFILHDVKARYMQYREHRAVLLSLPDFIGKFGANTRRLERLIGEVDVKRKGSYDAYREGRFDDAIVLIVDALKRLATISDDAVKLKCKALFWVYATEWSAVTGTLFLSTLVLYSLMVRRRAYTEVSSTRLGAA